jgi:hypothetical protein
MFDRKLCARTLLIPKQPGELQRKDTAPINTQVPPSRSGAGSTPRASTQEEAEAEWRRSGSQSGNTEDGNYDSPHYPESFYLL